MLYRSSVPADQPGDRPAEGSEVPPGGTEKSRRAVRAEEGAGDAHVVVVGRADVHHQVGGRAQPVPAAEVACPRRQRVGAHGVPGVALQLEASHREAGQGHGALAVGAHQKIA